MTGSVDQARRAYEKRHWSDALRLYRQAEEAGAELTADDLETMAVSAWLSGEPADTLLDRACDAYVSAERPHDAVRVAIVLVDYHALLAELGKAMGWHRRASRLIEGVPPGPGHARLELMNGFLAVMSGKVDEALAHVDKAHQLACEHRDEDSEALALSRRSRLLLRLGRLDEAVADADEAMLLVHRDRTFPVTGAIIYCSTIDFCRDLGDFERALEWTEAASLWITERQVCGFPGICRVHRAELLRIQGDHLLAAAEVQAALAVFERHRFRFGMGFALAEKGLQHLETGDLEHAEKAFADAVAVGHEPMPGAADLALRQGKPSQARAMLEAPLAEQRDNPLGRSRLLPSYVRTCIALDDLDAAAEATEELREIAEMLGTVGARAQAASAGARLHLAAGEPSEAVAEARAATRAWALIGACYELAEARELLARAYDATGNTVRSRLERDQVRITRDSLANAATLLADSADALPGPVPPPEDRITPAPLKSSSPIHEGVTLDDKIAIGPVLGIGGMGIVHAGRHLVTGRDVAVKVLKRSACGDAPDCARFLREARACGRIRHPNVVDIYDAGMHGDEPYIVMERLEGHTLEDRLQGGEPLPLEEALDICVRTAQGVAAAHEAGVVHRDLKPANIFLGRDAVKVLDFGISKQLEVGETNPGQLVGTPFYMSPEQILRPEEVDARTDLWALGAVLFELVAGVPPFVASSLPAVLHAITRGPEPDLAAAAPQAPDAVVTLVRHALQRDPDHRLESAAAMAEALARAAG